MSSRRPPPATCAICGAALPRNARACPECGADERTGWREASIYDGLELPDSAFAAAVDTTAPQGGPRHPLKWYWLAAALLVLIVLVLSALALW